MGLRSSEASQSILVLHYVPQTSLIKIWPCAHYCCHPAT